MSIWLIFVLFKYQSVLYSRELFIKCPRDCKGILKMGSLKTVTLKRSLSTVCRTNYQHKDSLWKCDRVQIIRNSVTSQSHRNEKLCVGYIRSLCAVV